MNKDETIEDSGVMILPFGLKVPPKGWPGTSDKFYNTLWLFKATEEYWKFVDFTGLMYHNFDGSDRPDKSFHLYSDHMRYVIIEAAKWLVEHGSFKE